MVGNDKWGIGLRQMRIGQILGQMFHIVWDKL